MSSEHEMRHKNATEDSVARRLARLRDRPLEMSAFEARIKAAIPPPATHSKEAEDEEQGRWIVFQMFSPFRAVAAALLLAITAYLAFLAFNPQPVLAHPERLASIYEEAVERHGHGAVSVSSLAEAKAALKASWEDVPALPDAANAMQLMSCCVHEIGKKRMACVTFEVDNAPVTLALAPSKDIRCPVGEIRVVNGNRYVLGSSNGVNMAMVERDGKWSCVMGKLPQEKLIDVLNNLSTR